MIDSTKAVFIPIDNRILNIYKGYILDGELLPDVKESDIYVESEYYEIEWKDSAIEMILYGIVLLLFAPGIILILLISAFFKTLRQTKEKIFKIIDYPFNLIFKKKKLRTRKIRNQKFMDAVEEDIPTFLNHCKSHFAKVIIYSYNPLTSDQDSKIKELIKKELIYSCQVITRLSDLTSYIGIENISIINSLLVITNVDEKNETRLLGFNPDDVPQRNVELLQKKRLSSKGNEDQLERTSCGAIIEMQSHVEYYLKAKGNAFLYNDSILFIEDEEDPFLNDYLKKNIENINVRLSLKGFKLLYFPSFQSDILEINNSILEYIRYRIPVLYSLTDNELDQAIKTILGNISSSDFYRMVLDELELPLFKRPCLLRRISGGSAHSENKFTYKPIEYNTKSDLDKFFDWYITQITITDSSKHVHHQLAQPPAQYDADWYFGKDADQDTEELKLKIDEIKKTGKYGVLVEAIMYMLATIKEDQPDIINKVKPLLEKKQLLESEVILSPIVIDKHYNILLPDFGNIEVKMHALPKTVYILFLHYPDGIRFKELYQHKTELLEIYNKVTNKYEKEEIEKAIDDLVDMTNPSINQKCARIREAFRNIMDEHIARHYYIDGLNGEPKRILLPKNLINIRY